MQHADGGETISGSRLLVIRCQARSNTLLVSVRSIKRSTAMDYALDSVSSIAHLEEHRAVNSSRRFSRVCEFMLAKEQCIIVVVDKY